MRRGGADKHRLYLAVYDNSKASGPGYPLQIHWALLLGTKREEPASLQKTHVRYHATNRTRTGHWEYERRAVECVRSPSMLGRVFLGKVDRRDVPVLDRVLGDPRRMRPRDPRWDCWKWVEEALLDLIGMNLVQLHARGIDLSHLLAFGQKVAVEVVTEGLDIGYGIPITVTYTGPGR
ncbi:hypothetical protein BD413DRAFT_466417 [Trametes elegans]|nr:hypothetical protein BD413DRAFT_466417 [Trametes elegans]